VSHILLGEWGFLDNLDDTSGNNITATANFTPTYIDGPTPDTRAIQFSGTGQTVTYGRTGLEPVAADGGIVTMAWIKIFSNHSNYTSIVHKTRAFDSTRHCIDLGNNNAFLVARWRDQLAFRESGNHFSDFQWHHICNVDSDGRYAWFVDGAVIQEASRTGTDAVSWENFPWVSGFDSAILSNDSASNVAFTGVRILSGTLSDVEVATWMNTPITAGRSGQPKIWDGSWSKHPAKVWNGTSWDSASMNGYDGAGWIAAK
jgi:hypothetical protein